MPDPIDKDEINDEESDLVFGYENSGQDTSKLDIIQDYLPEQNDYPAKTVLSEQHPEIIAAIENLTEMYPEIEHMEDMLMDFVAKFEKRQISVNGRSREEFLDILAGLSGGKRSDLEERQSRMEQMLKPMSESENDE